MKRQSALKRLLLISAATALLAAPVVAQPQKGPGHGPGPMAMGGPGAGPFGLIEFDTNSDGRIARAEFDAAQKARFAELDADKDGSATREEMKAAMDARREEARKARFTAMDADKNGQLSEAELQTGRGDGAGQPGPGPKMGMRGFGGPDGRGRGPGGPDGRMGPPDVNGDGKVSFEEFAARGAERFTAADADKNGVVTIAELRAQTPR